MNFNLEILIITYLHALMNINRKNVIKSYIISLEYSIISGYIHLFSLF